MDNDRFNKYSPKYTLNCHICNEEFYPKSNKSKICQNKHFCYCSKCGNKILIDSMMFFKVDSADKSFIRNFKFKRTEEGVFIKFDDEQLCKECKRKRRTENIIKSLKTEEYKKKMKESLKNRAYGIRQCEICGEEFIKRSAKAKYCRRDHEFICEECKEVHSINEGFVRYKNITNNFNDIKLINGYLVSTSDKKLLCTECNLKNHKISEETKKKISNTWKSKEVQDKRKRTNKERYGDEIYQHSEHYKKYNKEKFIKASHTEKAINKKKKNYRDKYGVDWPSQRKEIYSKIIETQKERYGGFHSQTKEFREYMSELTSKNFSNQQQFSKCLRCYYKINDKSYFLRSSYEFIYALYLSINDIEFEYENLHIKYKDKDGLERYYKPIL